MDMENRILIFLTDRPPVAIEDDKWPIIAEADDVEIIDGWMYIERMIAVRQHQDGRAVVYAGYSVKSNGNDNTNYNVSHGQILLTAFNNKEICAIIMTLENQMGTYEKDHGDLLRWQRIKETCIQDMPAEEFD